MGSKPATGAGCGFAAAGRNQQATRDHRRADEDVQVGHTPVGQRNRGQFGFSQNNGGLSRHGGTAVLSVRRITDSKETRTALFCACRRFFQLVHKPQRGSSISSLLTSSPVGRHGSDEQTTRHQEIQHAGRDLIGREALCVLRLISSDHWRAETRERVRSA